VIKKPERRKPRPDLGCRAIGWMYLKADIEVLMMIAAVFWDAALCSASIIRVTSVLMFK
jgi:hypothetical protein